MAKAKDVPDAKSIPEGDPLLTASEVAEMFSVDRSTVWRWVAAKALPAVRTPGGLIKVRRSHVAAIIGIATSAV